jgi:hypothetical protein
MDPAGLDGSRDTLGVELVSDDAGAPDETTDHDPSSPGPSSNPPDSDATTGEIQKNG